MLVPAEADLFWAVPSGTRMHLGAEAGVWTIPAPGSDWPLAVHAGVGWARHEGVVIEGFFGLQAIAWSDAGLVLPKLRARWVREDGLSWMLDVSGPAVTVSVGWWWGTP